MKRFLTVLLIFVAVFVFTVSAVCAPEMSRTDILKLQNPVPLSKLYSADGRTILVNAEKADIFFGTGWYPSPVTTIYARDNATAVVYTSEVENYLKVGWYLSPDEIPKHDKAVALTYDDGPGKYTSQILDCLARYDAKATFFVVGTNVNRYPETLKRAVSMGMEIGNHTVSHPKLTNLSSSGVYSEIHDNANNIEKITGVRPTLVRPPYGSYTKANIQTANQPFILWSIDTLDWKSRNADKVVEEALKNVKDGDIILMHDIYQSTAEATKRIVPALISRGFDVVTVSELAKRKGKTIELSAYRSFK